MHSLGEFLFAKFQKLFSYSYCLLWLVLIIKDFAQSICPMWYMEGSIWFKEKEFVLVEVPVRAGSWRISEDGRFLTTIENERG